MNPDIVEATEDAWRAAVAETNRLQRELDLSNADHIALWIEANTVPDEPMNQCATWLACRIVEAHEAALTAARPAIMAWQPIETAPADENILVAIEVTNNKTGASWWEQHTVVIDSETGEIRPDNDAGWEIDDYSHWQPLPAPPATAIRAAEPKP